MHVFFYVLATAGMNSEAQAQKSYSYSVAHLIISAFVSGAWLSLSLALPGQSHSPDFNPPAHLFLIPQSPLQYLYHPFPPAPCHIATLSVTPACHNALAFLPVTSSCSHLFPVVLPVLWPSCLPHPTKFLFCSFELVSHLSIWTVIKQKKSPPTSFFSTSAVKFSIFLYWHVGQFLRNPVLSF